MPRIVCGRLLLGRFSVRSWECRSLVATRLVSSYQLRKAGICCRYGYCQPRLAWLCAWTRLVAGPPFKAGFPPRPPPPPSPCPLTLLLLALPRLLLGAGWPAGGGAGCSLCLSLRRALGSWGCCPSPRGWRL